LVGIRGGGVAAQFRAGDGLCARGEDPPTDYSVWTAAAAAFLLGVVALREQGAEGTRNFDADARKQERDARARSI
jgi:hypothetical protein